MPRTGGERGKPKEQWIYGLMEQEESAKASQKKFWSRKISMEWIMFTALQKSAQ